MASSTPRMPPLVIDALIDPQSCAAVVDAARAIGFGPASRDAAGGPMVRDAAGQASDFAVARFEDPRLALRLYLQLGKRLPEFVAGRRLSRLGAAMQVIRYEVGASTPEHVDPQRVFDACEPERHESSELTLLVHLSDDFEGGDTQFKPGPSVPASTGRAIIFDRQHRHRGTPVTRGVKHVLRCDVFYEDDD